MAEALLTSNLDIFAEAINKERVVAYPTEAVFGLGSDPQNLQAVQRICKLKNRSLDLGLILIASDIHQILPYVDMDKLKPNNVTIDNLQHRQKPIQPTGL